MKDRVPLYPGRVKLTPVAGQANTYDMVRADSPQQEGTPLNKDSLLTDATAAAFGLGADATPDDVLDILKAGVLHETTGKYTKYSTAGALPVGATLSLNVNGKAWEFLVVHQGKPSDLYDDSCNGTWLLMKDIYENRSWSSDGTNKYETSDIHSYLNSTFLNLFDSNVRSAIKQVKIPYRAGGNSGTDQSGANGLSCKMFLLSLIEVGFPTNYVDVPVDGTKLDYFDTAEYGSDKRIALLNGTANSWWLRTPHSTAARIRYINASGTPGYDTGGTLLGIRPAFVLPSDFACEAYADSDGNFYPEQEYTTTLSDVLGNTISAGPKIAIGSYVGTGTYGAANPNSLTFDFAPKMVMVFQQANYQGSGVGNLVDSSASESYFVQLMDLLTTEYVVGRGFGARYNDYPRGKKSADGKTISWYHPGGAKYQCNLKYDGMVYSYIAIG